jgi:hypothetical protein
MPRQQQIHSHEKFESAKRLISHDKFSIHKVAKEFGIPYTTLMDHVNGQYAGYYTQFGPNRLLTEDYLTGYIKSMASRDVPLAREDVKRFAKEIVKRGQPRESLSEKWLRSFLKRLTDLVIR